MNKPTLHLLGACALLCSSSAFLVACAPAAGEMPPSTTPTTPGSAQSALDAIYGDWHEDTHASVERRQVFVPKSIRLGASRYRQTLHFGRDGSFSTLRLDPSDAHYECPGTFTIAAPDELNATCKDRKSGKNITMKIKILDAKKDRLEVQISP